MKKNLYIQEPLSLRVYSPVREKGFKYSEINQGQFIRIGNKEYHHFLFLLEGKIKISCNEFIGQTINEGEFVLIPISSDVSCKALSSCKIIVFTFDSFKSSCDKFYFQDLWKTAEEFEYSFPSVKIRYPLNLFLNNLTDYLRGSTNTDILHEIKHQELFILFRSLYSKEEVVSFFYPLCGKSLEFRNLILRNYLKVKDVDEIADIVGMKRKNFGVKFKEEFGIPPYQWLLNQKAKHIRYRIAESNSSLNVIMKEYGFTFAGHFTRFCKEQFNCTPSELKKQLKSY